MSRMGDTGNSGGGTNVGDAAQKMTEDLRELGSQVRDAAREKYEQYADQARGYYEHGRETAQEWEQTLENFVHEKPLQAVLAAAGVGLLIGLLWRR